MSQLTMTGDDWTSDRDRKALARTNFKHELLIYGRQAA